MNAAEGSHPDAARPGIPSQMAGRPVVSGLVVPFVTPMVAGRGPRFGALEINHAVHCLTRRLCGVCGRAHGRRMVLLMRGQDLPLRCTVEPPVHPECASYVRQACPMVAGRRSHHRASPAPIPEHARVEESTARLGAPADPWYAVWLTGYHVIHHPQIGQPAAAYEEHQLLKVRPIGSAPPPERFLHPDADTAQAIEALRALFRLLDGPLLDCEAQQ